MIDLIKDDSEFELEIENAVFIDKAKESAQKAEESAQKSEKFAMDAQSAKDDAETAADRAERALSTVDWAYFDVNADGYLIMTRSNIQNEIDFALSDDGNLEVNYE